MDTTTLVLIWDEVFMKLLEKCREMLMTNQQDTLPEILQVVLLIPLKNMNIQIVNFLFEQLQNPYIHTFWHIFLDDLLFYLYIGLMLYFCSQIIFALLKKMYQIFIGHHEVRPFDLVPIRKLFFLQCIHFIGFPCMKIVLEIYPDFIKEMTNVMANYTSNNHLGPLLAPTLSTDFLLLEVICLCILVAFCLIILFQFFQQGINMAFAFIQSYLALLYLEDFSTIFLTLKEAFIQAFVVFLCQKLLLQTIIVTTDSITTITSLLQLLAMFFTIVCMPKLFISFFNRKDVIT